MSQDAPTDPHLAQKATAAEDLQKAKSFLLISEDMQTGEVIMTSAGENPFILSVIQQIENAQKKVERMALTRPSAGAGAAVRGLGRGNGKKG